VSRHVYVHVPFCVRRCTYCDFSIAVRRRIPAQEYLAAVLREVALIRAADPAPAAGSLRELGSGNEAPPSVVEPEAGLQTLYFGGGTPSLLPVDALAALLTSLREAFHERSSRDDLEVTLEANPEDVTGESARAWAVAGVNRVSLGAQSFDDAVLKWMHRSHDGARIGEAVDALRHAGIHNISLDLIFGLPAELSRDWRRDLERAVALDPTHLSLYGLAVEERTPLARWISRGAVRAAGDERYAEEYLLAHARLATCGYRFYEVSNAAREGFRSRHNSAYWSGRAYLGLGPAAHSYDGRARRWNLAAWEAYRRAVSEDRRPAEAEETLTDEQRHLERLYLGLRTDAGVPLAALCRPLPPSAARCVARGWVHVTKERLVCTPEGWLRLDGIVRDLTDGSIAA